MRRGFEERIIRGEGLRRGIVHSGASVGLCGGDGGCCGEDGGVVVEMVLSPVV